MKNDRFEIIKSLHGLKKLEYIWDYYRYRIAAGIVILIIAVTAINMLVEGRRHYRLDICAVLNTEDDCSSWFKDFEKSLAADGGGRIRVNYDQPFDYDNRYYYVQELEVMTTVSSYRMDAAVCNGDMYSYLLAINACARLNEVLDPETFNTLTASGAIKEDTAALQADKNGQVDPADGIPGFYGVNLTETAFGQAYNIPADGSEPEPLYAVIISNTDNMPDAVTLIKELIK